MPEPKIVNYSPQSPLKMTLPKPMGFPFEQSNYLDQRINLGNEQPWETSEFARPEQTTAIHRGGAVLKIKLG